MARCNPIVSSRVTGLERRASRGEMPPNRPEWGRPARRKVPNPPRGVGSVSRPSVLLGVFGTSMTKEESNDRGGEGGMGPSAVVDTVSISLAVRALRAAAVPPLTEATGSDSSIAGVKSSRFLRLVPRICSALLWDGPGLRGGASKAD